MGQLIPISSRYYLRHILSVVFLVGIFFLLSIDFVFAQQTITPQRFPVHPKSIDIIWVLISSFLIFFMQAGFSMVEVGFTRVKNAGNVVMKNLSDFACGTIAFFLLGYGLMFGKSRLGMVGSTDFFLNHILSNIEVNNWEFARMMFQVVFAATAATIVSGAMAERTRFIGYLAYSLIISAFIYPVAGHWIWGGGWLARLGMIDFAGSTVVHSLGGWVSLAGVVVLGPRIGRFTRTGVSVPIPGHNIPLAALGVFIMWLGWYGFNTGSTFSGLNPSIAIIAVNTTLSGACGAMAAMLITWLLKGKPDVGITLNGALAGLVASTATCALVNPYSAMVIGMIAGGILVSSIRMFDRLRIDDAVGAISVHGLCGVWGTLAAGLFAEETYVYNSLGYHLNGLFFGGGVNFLLVQIIGVVSVFIWAFGVAWIFFKLIDKFVGLRVSPEEEIRGLDFSEHFMSSYPLLDEFQKRQERLQEELKRVRELSILHEISNSMQVLNIDEILHLILDGVTKAIGFDRTRLYLINEDKNVLECKIAVGIDKDKIKDISLPLQRENSMVARSVIEKRPFIVEDAGADPRVNKHMQRLFNLKSFAVVPLIGRDKVLGAVTADNLFSDRVITPEKFESLITFTNQAGFALENAKIYDELKSFSRKLEERVKIATEDLKKAQDKLIQSEKLAALGKLSAGIAHEIRNPLTSIKVLIHSLSDRIKNVSDEQNDIKVIEEEIERMNQLISRVLDFARPRQPEFSLTDINSVIEDTIALVTPKFTEQDIILEKRLSQLGRIQADSEQMRQVFLNLFFNAIQSMPEGGRLIISTEQIDGMIRIEVRDEGKGVPSKVKDRLFEPFFTTKEEGIGLGLSIVKRIIDEHKGTIGVEDNNPKGTVFIITLPMA